MTSAHIKDKAHYESALSDVRDQARVRGVEAEDLRHQLATAKENLEAALRRVASVEQVLFNPARLATVVVGTWCHSCHVLGTRGCAHAVCMWCKDCHENSMQKQLQSSSFVVDLSACVSCLLFASGI